MRAGLVRDIDTAGPRTNWFLGRLRLLRARRAIYELAVAARCWAQIAAPEVRRMTLTVAFDRETDSR